MTPRELGARLAAARHAAGLSQQQVADKLGMRRPAISEIETGERDVKALELDRLAHLYGVALEWLLGRDAVAQAA